MECKNCHSKWETGKSASKTYTECPFCGASLADADEETSVIFDNSKETLVFIIRRHGVEVLLGNALKNFFVDYAPGVAMLRKNVIFSVSSSGAADILKNSMTAEVGEQEIAFRKAVGRVIDTYGIERSLVESVMLEFTEALGWKIPAVTGSIPAPQTQNGSATGKDDAEEMERLKRLAEQGDADAQYKLGTMYENGRGVGKDETEAVKWYQKAAEQGHAAAQCNLGYMYATGSGIGTDYAEAVKWFRKTAEQGNADAQFGLGHMYLTGRGVGEDEAEAVKWFRKAAKQGHMSAQIFLDSMYKKLSAVTGSVPAPQTQNGSVVGKKTFLPKRIAEQRGADAQCNLGNIKVSPTAKRQTKELFLQTPQFAQQLSKPTAHVTDMSYFQLENNGHALVKYVGPEYGNVIIPQGVTTIRKEAFKNCSGLQCITLPRGVTKIEESAFEDCSALQGIILPQSVTYIDGLAFSGCSSLKDITLPESIVQVKAGTFKGCSSLQKILLSNHITEIGAEAFRGCSSLEIIFLPNHITEIGAEAFSGCSSLKDIILPECIVQIRAGTFKGCSSLLNVSHFYKKIFATGELLSPFRIIEEVQTGLPIHITEIGAEAFSGCSSLQNISLPEKVILGIDVFKGCTSLRTRPGGQLKTDSMDISCFEFDATCHVLIKYIGSDRDVVIPEGVWGIFSGAFKGCSSLQSIVLPRSITEIGAEAFSGCSNLKDITLPESIVQIKAGTFKGCSSLQSIVLPRSITEIGAEAFSGGTSFRSISLPEDITEIGEEAFSGCTSLQSISFLGIGRRASITQIKAGTFKGCSSLQSIKLPCSITEIGSEAFRDCSDLQSITLYGEISSIADDAFECDKKRSRIICPLTIRARKGSYAQQYAKRMRVRFRSYLS